MNKCFSIIIGSTLLISLSLVTLQCGGGDSDDTTPTGNNATTANGTVVALSTGFSGVGEGISASLSEPPLEAVIKNQTGTIEVEETVDCTGSGSFALSLTGTISGDPEGGTGTINMTGTMTFSDCAETASVTLSDGSTCDFSSTVDGAVTCEVSGSVSEDDVDLSIGCETASACSGMTVTVGGTMYTVGVDISATQSGLTEEPTFGGTICIDGSSFDVEDIESGSYVETELGVTCS